MRYERDMCFMNVSRSFLSTNDIKRDIFVKNKQICGGLLCLRIHIYRPGMTVVSSSIHATGERICKLVCCAASVAAGAAVPVIRCSATEGIQGFII